MSKIFDSMRRAEDERRKRASRTSESVESQVEPAPVPTGVERAAQLPDGILRELGILRNSIEVAFAGQTKRTILFASAMSGEGTTTIASNFAKVLALQGQERVLVCEMNARKPKFPEVFSVDGEAGVTEYFSKAGNLTNYVRNCPTDDLDVVHVGSQDATIIQLHLKQVFPKLLDESLRNYDTMIIDAPPIISSPETPPMTEFVDGVVIVVQAGKTKREVVQRAMESIRRFNGNILGVVLNRKRYYIPSFLYRRI